MPVDHYENFPVASFLVPRHLRRPIETIYRFARSADDIADEGDASPKERLAGLAAYQAELDRIAAGAAPQPPLFLALADVIRQHGLPLQLFRDLLDAFAQDVVKKRYADYPELLDYCRRSANPVGRLVLHLFGRTEAQHLEQSDCICSALQLINFWQDLSVDLPRRRWYVPQADAAAQALRAQDLLAQPRTPASDRLVADLARWARHCMEGGAPLVHRLPGRAGWELRLVVQGGLRVLDKIDALQGACLTQRPRIRAWDAPLLLVRAMAM